MIRMEEAAVVAVVADPFSEALAHSLWRSLMMSSSVLTSFATSRESSVSRNTGGNLGFLSSWGPWLGARTPTLAWLGTLLVWIELANLWDFWISSSMRRCSSRESRALKLRFDIIRKGAVYVTLWTVPAARVTVCCTCFPCRYSSWLVPLR